MRYFNILLVSLLLAILITGLFFVFEIAPYVYSLYEENILHGKYQGETKAKYYIEFLYRVLFPAVWFVCVFFVMLLYKARKFNK